MRARLFSVSSFHAWPASSGLALFFLALEWLKAQRSSQWAGFLARDLVGAGLAFTAYALAVVIVFSIVRMLLQRCRVSGRTVESAALLCGGVVVWGLLSVHREETPTLDDVIVATALIGCSGAMAVGQGRWWSTARFGALLIALGLSAVSALVAAGEFALFRPDRATLVTIYPALWACVSAALLFRCRF